MADNRTDEFLFLAQALPPTSSSANNRLTPTSSSALKTKKDSARANTPAYQQLRSFHTTASDISRDIAGTSALLTELTNLVRHTSATDSQQQQAVMNSLVVRIKTSMERIHGNLDHASRQVQRKRSGIGQQAGQEAANMVDGLQTVFAEAANDFKTVLQQRTESMKEQAEFQKQVYRPGDDGDEDDNPMPNMSSLESLPPVYGGNSNGNGADAGFPTLDLTSSLMSPGEPTGSGQHLPRPHGISGSYGSAYQSPYASGGSSSLTAASPLYTGASHHQTAPLTPLDIQRYEEGHQELQQDLIPLNNQDYLQARADAMSTVETNLVELGTMFNRLGAIVNEHNELVQRVDDNVNEANTNLNLSMDVLTDTLYNLRTNRMLALRIFAVLIVFIIGFVIFAA